MVVCLPRLLALLLVLGASEGQVNRIKYEGNRGFSNSRLAKVVYMTKDELFTYQQVAKDSSELIRFYRNQGFPWIQVKWVYLESRNLLTYYIAEGARLEITEIKIIGVAERDIAEIRSSLTIKENAPPVQLWIADSEERIRRYYEDRGYYHVVVETDTFITGTELEISYTVAPGNPVWYSDVSYRGTQDFLAESFLVRTTRLHQGDRYSADEIDRASRRLYATALFDRVEVKRSPPQSGSEDSLDIAFNLVPAKVRIILLGGGLQTPTNSIVPDRLLLSAGWENLNLFRTGVSIGINVEFNPSFRGEYDLRAEIRNRYPNLLPWGWSFSLSPYWEHSRKFDLSDSAQFMYVLGGEAGLEKDFSEKLRLGISMQAKQTWVTDSVVFEGVGGFTNFLRTSLLYDNRNDFFNPSTGVFLFPYVDWAGNPLGGINDFARFSADFRNYLALPLNLVVAWRLKTGLIIPHSGMSVEDISYTEKFSLGGMGSVRALDYRSVGPDSVIAGFIEDNPETPENESDTIYQNYGTFLLLNSTELRTPYAFGWVGLVFFMDAGLCSRAPDDVADHWGWGPGIGIRVNTPVGPVRLDYAKNAQTPFNPNWRDAFGGRIEIGFLQSF